MLDHLNIGEEINHFTKTPLVQLRTGEVLRKNIFEALVFFLNTAHCIVNHRANFRRVSGSSNRAPSCILRDKEDVFGSVFVLVLFKSIAFFNQLLVLCFKAIRNVFQENQSENDRLVFGCVDVSAQDASRVPDLFFKADIACIISAISATSKVIVSHLLFYKKSCTKNRTQFLSVRTASHISPMSQFK